MKIHISRKKSPWTSYLHQPPLSATPPKRHRYYHDRSNTTTSKDPPTRIRAYSHHKCSASSFTSSRALLFFSSTAPTHDKAVPPSRTFVKEPRQIGVLRDREKTKSAACVFRKSSSGALESMKRVWFVSGAMQARALRYDGAGGICIIIIWGVFIGGYLTLSRGLVAMNSSALKVFIAVLFFCKSRFERNWKLLINNDCFASLIIESKSFYSIKWVVRKNFYVN